MHDSITGEAMNHDPLCPQGGGASITTTEGLGDFPCLCDLIAKVRENEHTAREEDGPWFRSVVHGCCEEKQTAYADGQRDMLAKCIAFIEEAVPWSHDNWIAVDERAAILAALRALQEKP